MTDNPWAGLVDAQSVNADRGDRWGTPERWWYGPAPVDLHDGKGTTWYKDPAHGYWPDCCNVHRPKAKRR